MKVGKVFANWIKDRINKYEFVENEDFKLDLPNLANQKSHGGDRKTKYYSLTLDMAKELSMMEKAIYYYCTSSIEKYWYFGCQKYWHPEIETGRSFEINLWMDGEVIFGEWISHTKMNKWRIWNYEKNI